jgi:hypothetical protein
MYLDGEEERMLRAIVHSAVVAAATGHPFSGEFHRFAVNASCLQVNENGVAEVGATIGRRGITLARLRCTVARSQSQGGVPAYILSSGEGLGQSC